MKQRIALLGSTGSIGVQTLDIVRENSELFEITTLTAHRNWEALARQAEEFAPDSVVIADDSAQYDALRRALADRPSKVYAGADAIRQVVQADTVDTVVNALVGYAGLLPTVAAIEAGKKVALANKGDARCGRQLRHAAGRRATGAYPADRLRTFGHLPMPGGRSVARAAADRHLFGRCTARRTARAARQVTVEQALRHPQWRMGAKITIDSATLVNKGIRSDRSPLALRDAGRTDLGADPPAVGGTLDGRVRRRRDQAPALLPPAITCPSVRAALPPPRRTGPRSSSASPTTRRSPSRNPTARNIRRSTWPTTACGAAAY